MNLGIFSWTPRLGRQAKWVLGALMVAVAVVPSLWLAILEQQTNARLVEEVERSLHSDAVLFSERLAQITWDILYAENVQSVVERAGFFVSDPDAPGRVHYDVDVASGIDSLVAYPFFIDLTDSSIFAGRAAVEPGRLAPLLQRSAGGAVEGALEYGLVPTPEGGLPVIYRIGEEGGRAVIRGVVVRPEVVRRAVLPLAFERLKDVAEVRRGRKGFTGEIFGFEVETPEARFWLNAVDFDPDDEAAGVYRHPLALGDLLPGWALDVHYFNALKDERWQRYLAGFIPLVIVLIGVAFTARMAMREVELSRVKSLFVSNVSHELKTPLTKIQFFNDLLRGLGPDAEEKRTRYHRVIEQECERLTILIDNVLDLNRIERGQMKYQFADVPIAEVVTEVVETFNVVYEARGYHIDLQADETLPTMRVDPGAIKQALINLIDNAVKYSQEPHTIVVRAARQRHNGESGIVLAVRDRGMGIPKAKLKLIFEEFYRVESGREAGVTGSGLGLALVNHIVRAHHGKIDVESEEGQGSTFTIFLPDGPKRARPG